MMWRTFVSRLLGVRKDDSLVLVQAVSVEPVAINDSGRVGGEVAIGVARE